MTYVFIKFIHIVSSTILFGTGLGTASVMLYAHCTRNIMVIANVLRYVVLADWIFTLSSAIIQPITGFYLIHLAQYSLQSFWLYASIIGYGIAGACWIPVVFLQIRMRNLSMSALHTQSALPQKYYRYFTYWFILGWPAFFSLVGVFYLMTSKIS